MSTAIDVREGGRWTLAQRAKNDVLWIAAVAALAITKRLPPRVLRMLGRALGAALHAAIPSARRMAVANVIRAFPDLDRAGARALVRRSYLALGETLGDTVSMMDASRPLDPLPF